MAEPLQPPRRALDEVIAESLAQAQASGELATARSWGKPLDLGDGYDETPAELRMPMKILKDAGVQPFEVTLMHQIAELRAQLDAPVDTLTIDDAARKALRQRLAELQQNLALRLEKLGTSGTL